MVKVSKIKAALACGVVAVLLVGCSSESSSSDGASGTSASGGDSVIRAGWVNETDLTPTTGGQLSVTLAAKPPGLDPTTGTLGIPTQGPLMYALYDALMQYDPDTGEISGRLAEGMTHNDDFTEWTLQLRPGVTFTDGTPLDAAAVLYNVNRAKSAKNPSAVYPSYFSSVEATGPLTVTLRLDTPLNNVDALFASELGFMVSPTAADAAGDAFSANPVGAGPFKVRSYSPDTELVLEKNPDFALGDVALDGIRMTWSPDPGANIDKVATGQSDISFFGNSPTNTARTIDDGLPTYTTLVGGNGFAINNATGRSFPGSDARIRQAISMAIDPDVINERAFDGQGIMGRYLLPPGNPFHVDTPYSVGDVDRARTLVDEVKAETGWDGSLTLTTAPPEDQALAAQAQLNAVGFDVSVDVVTDYTQLVDRILAKRDFDVAAWVMTTYDTNIYQSLSRSLSSSAPTNYSQVKSPEIDAALLALRSAPDDASFRAALDQLATVFQSDQPFFYIGANPFTTITTPEVGGLDITANGCFFWDQIFRA